MKLRLFSILLLFYAPLVFSTDTPIKNCPPISLSEFIVRLKRKPLKPSNPEIVVLAKKQENIDLMLERAQDGKRLSPSDINAMKEAAKDLRTMGREKDAVLLETRIAKYEARFDPPKMLISKKKLLKMKSNEVKAGPPLVSDYKANINDDGYKVFTELPQVKQEDIAWLRKQVLRGSPFGFTTIKFNKGKWFINDIQIQGSLADRMTAIRREFIACLPAKSKATAKEHFFSIEVRVDYPTEQLAIGSKSPLKFHIDDFLDSPFGILDTIEGEGTFVRGSAGNVFQAHRDEAIMYTGKSLSTSGTIHAVPENSDPPRIFMRYRHHVSY